MIHAGAGNISQGLEEREREKCLLDPEQIHHQDRFLISMLNIPVFTCLLCFLCSKFLKSNLESAIACTTTVLEVRQVSY